MADRLVTALTAITGANTATGDLFIVDDVSDTTDDASGTVKKITRAELVNAIRAAAGMTPTQQVLTVGSGTYTTPTGCTAIIVEVVAGGGGGGACPGHASQAAAASGGGSGGYARKLITTPDATYAYTVGAKGTGGAAGSNNGNAGSDSTFGAGGGLITAKGGGVGVLGALGTTVAFTGPVGGSAVSTGGDVNAGGNPGDPGLRQSATVAFSGAGGASYFGGPGGTRDDDAAGAAATGPGSGGGGALVSSTNTARAGGDGADGVIVVTEFYT